jgi:MFS family permease
MMAMVIAERAMIPAVSFFDGILGGLKATVFQLLFVLGPLFVFAVVLHLLERFTSRRLSERLGWWSILWTGWIGTPIHEASHAVFCLLFGHKIKEIAFFKPDRKTGCLGYVHHSYNRRNPYCVIGNFFIGSAPLLGGSLALFAILFLFYPEAAKKLFTNPGMGSGNFFSMVGNHFSFALSVLSTIWTQASLLSWPFYLFLYLIICVGSHLAPSAQDMEGMGTGFLVFAGLLLLINVVAAFFGGFSDQAVWTMARVLGPVAALFALAAALNTVVAAIVFAVTSATDLFRGGRPDRRG